MFIASNLSTSFYISKDFRLYDTGLNSNGQLGCGDTTTKTQFTPARGLGEQRIIALATAPWSTLALTEAGGVYGTGWNGSGQLGCGDTTVKTQFTPAQGLAGQRIIALAIDSGDTLALTDAGGVYGTGVNQYGQLGCGDIIGRTQFTPAQGLEGQRIIALATNNNYTLALTDAGGVYGTGQNDRGQLGCGDTADKTRFTPAQGLAGQRVIALVTNDQSTLVLTDAGGVYGTGQNNRGQLGCGDTTNKTQFTPVQGLVGQRIIALAIDRESTLALTNAGGVYGTGQNNRGQLGCGDTTNKTQFTPAQGLVGQRIIALAIDSEATLALTDAGGVYGTGANNYGQLGCGDTTDRTQFTLARGLVGQRIIALATNLWSTIALTDAGGVYGTGYNGSGQLSCGDTTDRTQFTPAQGLPVNPRPGVESSVTPYRPSKNILHKLRKAERTGPLPMPVRPHTQLIDCPLGRHGLVSPVGYFECPHCVLAAGLLPI